MAPFLSLKLDMWPFNFFFVLKNVIINKMYYDRVNYSGIIFLGK